MVQVIHEFITEDEQRKLLTWFEDVRAGNENKDVSDIEILKSLQETFNGWTTAMAFSDAEIVQKLVYSLVEDQKSNLNLPTLAKEIRQSAMNVWGFPDVDKFSFIQTTQVGKGGFVKSHYDAAPDGYIMCRSNLFLETWDGDNIEIDKEKFYLQSRSLVCFAPSIQKHKTIPSQCDKRTFISFGFLVPYEIYGIDPNHTKVRLSRKIWKGLNEKEI